MGTAITILTWILRLAGFVSTAEKLYAAYAGSKATDSAEEAQKAVANEDHRELAIAAAPAKPVDDVLARMQRSED